MIQIISLILKNSCYSNMLNRLSLNPKRSQLPFAQHYNEKQNNQKNLNRHKRTSRLSQLDPCMIIKQSDMKNYQTNTSQMKLNLSLNYNTNHQPIEFKPKHTSRNITSSMAHMENFSLQKPKFVDYMSQKQQTNTQQFCELYGNQIIQSYKISSNKKNDFLKNHQVTPLLRARMLDWMVQVMKSYKFTNKTYFAGVELMDRYFKQIRQNVALSQLHITGVVCMFIATKMEQIYPLKVKTVYEKIVHKKISKQLLIDMEMKIFNSLDHKVNSFTFYDLALLKLQSLGLTIQTSTKQNLQQCLALISKFIHYDYDLYRNYDSDVFSNVVLSLAADICHVDLGKNYKTEEQIQCRQKVLKSIAGFKQNYKGLNNLLKFTDDNIVNLVQNYANRTN